MTYRSGAALHGEHEVYRLRAVADARRLSDMRSATLRITRHTIVFDVEEVGDWGTAKYVFINPAASQDRSAIDMEVVWCDELRYLEKNLCRREVFECVRGSCLTSRSTRSRAETRAPG